MPYPPPLPLPVPTSMPPVPDSLLGIDLASIGLMNPEEELSNQQLDFTVQLICLHMSPAEQAVRRSRTCALVQSSQCPDHCNAMNS